MTCPITADRDAWRGGVTEREAALVEALGDLCASMEYWAGCDEGSTPDFASCEIMSSGGAWPSVAYDKARALLARAHTATEAVLGDIDPAWAEAE